MREVELKVLEINKPALIKKLRAMGAKKIGRFFIVAKQFDFKNKPIKKRGDLFRLRTVGKTAVMTYKQRGAQNKRFKVMDEFETTIGNMATVEKIMSHLGLRPITHQEKWRTSFKRGPVSFEIDEYPGIPAYLEIEGPPKQITRALAELGIAPKDTTNLSAGAVFKQYGVSFKNVRFKKR